MTPRQFFLTAMILLVLSSPVAAQQDDRGRSGVSAPEETDITLPETFLEVQELLVEQVDAALPQVLDLLPPVLTVPLPTEDDLRVSDAVFDVPGMDDPSARTEPAAGESSFFSEGVLGTGTNYHILGSLSLFKLGADPRFRFEFAHESIDGYQFKPPGTGYFHREDTIEGWIASGIRSRLSAEAEARFFQREEGLQNRTEGFYSAGHRYLSGYTDFTYAITERFELGFGADAGYVERILTVKDDALESTGEEELFVNPSVHLGYRRPNMAVSVNGDYEFRSFGGGDITTVQVGYAGLGAEFGLRDVLFIEAAAGARLSVAEGLLFPFRVAATTNLDDTLTFRLDGGYRVESQRYFDLWQRIPLLAVGAEGSDRPSSERAWYGGALFSWATPDRRLTIEAGSELALRSKTLDVGAYDPVGSTFGFRQENLATLTPNAAFTWRRGPLEMVAGWKAHLIDRTILDPAQSLTASLEAIHSSERFGANIAARLDIFEEPTIPRLGAGGFFNVARGVQFLLELQDLLAPGLPDGRPQLGGDVTGDYPFIEPGFRLILKAQVSL